MPTSKARKSPVRTTGMETRKNLLAQKECEEFGKRIVALRKEMDMTQQEFADALGIPRASVGFYENGARFPDYSTLRKMRAKTGCSFDYLFGFSKAMRREYTYPEGPVKLGDRAIDNYNTIDNMGYISTLDFILEWAGLPSLVAQISRYVPFGIQTKPEHIGDIRNFIRYQLTRSFEKLLESFYDAQQIRLEVSEHPLPAALIEEMMVKLEVFEKLRAFNKEDEDILVYIMNAMDSIFPPDTPNPKLERFRRMMEQGGELPNG